ncbi:MAG: DUF937 domain-containing protein [Pseudomonadota bacterium]
MSLLAVLQQAQGGSGLGALAQKFGMDANQVNGLAEMLAPAISGGVKRRAQSGGLDAIMNQLMGEASTRYLDDPAQAATPEAQAEGNRFLEEILGSSDARQAFSEAAAERADLETAQAAEILPSLAAMMQGGLQRGAPDDMLQGVMRGFMSGGASTGIMGVIGAFLGRGSGGGPDLGDLGRMLDGDGDGSPLDDILEKIMR